MEEQRIGMMYLNLIKRSFTRFWDRMFGSGLRRSPLLPWLLLLVVVIPVVGWSLHVHGKFATLKREVRGQTQTAPVVVPRPGGADPLVLTRQETPGSSLPEFLSATVLPGLGMDVLQLTAYLPSHGEVELLAAPTVQQMADVNPETHPEQASSHGALQAPWAGLMVGLVPPAGGSLNMVWHGRTFELPAAGGNAHGVTTGGLLAFESMDASKEDQGTSVAATGSLTGSDFSGRWPSKSDVHVGMQLAAKSFDLRLQVRNTGTEPEPVGIGWEPAFQILGGDRAQVQLRLPGGDQLQTGERLHSVPTGKTGAPLPELARFQSRLTALGNDSADAALVHLKAGMLDSEPMAEYRDPASGYGLRMTAMSATVREFRVSAPTTTKSVSFGMQTNLDDPLGSEWSGEPGGGIAVLQPGQSLEWRIRLEIFPISNPGTPLQ